MAEPGGPSVVAEPGPERGLVLTAGTVVAKNYRVVRRLGAGGMGTVYLGENTTLDQRVVIKVLQVGERGAGEVEARLLASLDHPNVVHVYAYDPKWDCIVMQYLGGRSLSDEVYDEAPKLDLISSLRVASQTALALAAVHERGVVHRDVKPENIMLDFTAGEVKWVKLIDLGTALRVGRTVDNPAGTPDYCGPEQFDGSIGASPANDVYALGVTLFLLCTRRFPFIGEPEELALAHRDEPAPDLVSTYEAGREATGAQPLEPQLMFVLERVGELVERMLAKEVRARPDAREVAHKLSDIVDGFSSERTHAGFRSPEPILLTSVAAKTSTMVLPRVKGRAGAARPSSHRNKLITVLAVVLLASLAGWFLMRQVEPSVPAAPEVVPVVAAPPVPVIDAGLAVAVLEPEPAQLEPLPHLEPLPPKPVIKKVVVPQDCTPDERWRRTIRAELQRHRDEVGRASDGKRYAAYEEDERRVMKSVVEAQSVADCVAASARVDQLVTKYSP